MIMLLANRPFIRVPEGLKGQTLDCGKAPAGALIALDKSAPRYPRLRVMSKRRGSFQLLDPTRVAHPRRDFLNFLPPRRRQLPGLAQQLFFNGPIPEDEILARIPPPTFEISNVGTTHSEHRGQLRLRNAGESAQPLHVCGQSCLDRYRSMSPPPLPYGAGR